MGAAPLVFRRLWHTASSELTRFACPVQTVPAGTRKLPNLVHSNRA